MGILSFLKKQPPQKLKLCELKSFLSEYVQKSGISSAFSEYQKHAQAHISNAENALTALKDAELLNKNIPQRAHHLLEGNKKTYIQKTNALISSISLPEKPDELEDFSRQYSSTMVSFSKDTHRNYMIVAEFHRDELYVCVKELRGIDEITKKMISKIHKVGMQNVLKINTLILEMQQRNDSEANLKQEMLSDKRASKRCVQELDEINEQIGELNSSSDARNLEENKQELESLKVKKAETLSLLSEPFSELHRALRKYRRTSLDENLIDKYMSDVFSALKSDHDMKILEILSKLKNAVPQLELKNSQRIENAIESITREFLLNNLDILSQAQLRIEEILRIVDSSTVSLRLKELEDQNHALSKQKEQLESGIKDKTKRLKSQESDIAGEINELLKPLNASLE